MLTLAQGFILPFDDLLLLEQGAAVAPTNLLATIVAGPQVNLAWGIAGIAGETGYSVQRRDMTTGGTFAELIVLGPNVSSYEGDAGPFTPNHRYAYRVEVIGGESDGLVSNVVAVFGGFTVVPTVRLSAMDDEFSRG